MTAVLEVNNVVKTFGGLTAVEHCSLQIEQGTITGLIGPNGAGKTTLFNIIAGEFAPDSGTVRLDGEDVTGLPAYRMFQRRLLRTFQIPHEFSHLSTTENLMMVPSGQGGENLFRALFQRAKVHSEEAELQKKALDVIDFIGLSHVKNELAGNLSGGQKKLLELGRTLMVNAKIILLDEIGAGVNRSLLNILAQNIIELNRKQHMTFVIIEHNMELISRLCHVVNVLVEGKVITTGTPQQVLSNPQVVEAYFGGGKLSQSPGEQS